MPMKLNLGLCKKVGQPDFGSCGASCHVELELDSTLLQQDLEGFHRHVRDAFHACRQAVEDELSRHRTAGPATATNGNGSHDRPAGNGSSGGGRHSSHREATTSQVRAIHAIANRQRLDLAAELRNRFDVDRPEDLSLSQASELIDALKGTANGSGGGR